MSAYTTDIDTFVASSSVSIPFYQLTLPKTEKIKGRFIYNYYTRDEGISETVSLDAVDAQTDEYDFIVENWENGTYPRQIEIKFGSRDAYKKETLAVGTIAAASNDSKIIFEDAPFDTRFSSVLVHDTSIDEKIYNIISGSTPKRTKLSNDILNVAKLQSAGHRFSKADAREQVENLYSADIKSVNLGISTNNLFSYDLLNTVQIWQASAFVDEFASILPDAKNEQDEERTKTASGLFRITENEVDIELKSISSTFVRADTSRVSSFGINLVYPTQTTKVGYIIEKYGEQVDGTTLRYPDIVLEDASATSYTDYAVRYGGIYKYKIRTVYKTVITTANESGRDSFEGFKISSVLVASTGVFTTVNCEERIPPLPPNNISFQQTLEGLYIRWNFPINTQKDIKRFQIFRRPNIQQAFSLVKEINFDRTILPYTSGENVPVEKIIRSKGPVKHYIDDEFKNIDSDYIYALCAIDAHGYSSAYSEQFRVRFDKLTGKILISRISPEGAPKPYPNVNIQADFFSDIIKDSGHSRVRIYFDPEYRNVTLDGSNLNLISTTTTGQVTYKLNMTEINLGQSQTINIVIGDEKVTANGIPVSIARFYTAD
jgi:hypothetical protein